MGSEMCIRDRFYIILLSLWSILIIMIYISHHLLERPSRWHHYQIAEQCVAFPRAIASLAKFCVDSPPINGWRKSGVDNVNGYVDESAEHLSHYELLTDQNSELYYQDTLIFNHRKCLITFRRSEPIGLSQIDVDGQPACAIDLSGSCIKILNDKPLDDIFNLELITGPALIVLLSAKSIYCLHASAVTVPDENLNPINVAFIAESGVGKSTLSKDAGEAWVQCSDDILPVRFDQSLKLFRDFPQLKLPEFSISNKVIENNGLSFIFNISKQEASSVVIEKIKPVDAALTVVRHTVASRLFEPQIMRQHLDFAQNLASSVGVYQISYPRDLSQLTLLRKSISELSLIHI